VSAASGWTFYDEKALSYKKLQEIYQIIPGDTSYLLVKTLTGNKKGEPMAPLPVDP
jgi:hypothetical protein